MKRVFKRALAVLLCLVMLGGAAPAAGLAHWFTMQASAKTITEYKLNDIIEFGWYPQSEVTDSAIVSRLNAQAPAWDSWTSYGYYSGPGTRDDGRMKPGDYMRYTDILLDGVKYRGVKFTSYRPWCTGLASSADNTDQDNNGYYTNTVYWFRFDPLRWRVLDPAAGLVLCETIIDSQAFNNYVLQSGTDVYGHTAYWGDSAKTHYANNYAESSIRKWLNSDFYGTAFSAKQQAIIPLTELDNKCVNRDYPAYDAETTYDKIFLLSYSDVLNPSYGFSSSDSTYDTARMAQGSDYAKCQGLWVSTSSWYGGNSFWRLRSPTAYYGYAYNVYCDGSADYYYGADLAINGVRPALRLHLTSDIFQSDVSELFSGTYDLRSDLTFSQKSVIADGTPENEEYRKIYFDGLGTAMDGANGTPKYTVPGLSKTDNMVPQGIAFWNQKQALLISAYSADKSRPSVIYAMNGATGAFTAQYSIRTSSGADSFAHVGGIAVSDNNLYLSYGDAVAYISLDDFTDGDGYVTIDGTRSFAGALNGADVSYASVTDNTLYFGNFYLASASQYNTPAGETNSAVLGIALTDTASSESEWAAFCAAVPRRINLPNDIDRVQGATLSQGRLFLNTSYGRTNESRLLVSDPLADPTASQTLPLSSFRAVKGMPMLEDMEYSNGYLYTVTESAAYNYMESGDGKGRSERPTDVVWRIDADALLSACEYTTVALWETDMEDGVCKKTGSLDMGFRDSWFSRSAKIYNPYLGAFCSDCAVLGYAPASNIRAEMAQLGFTVPANLINMRTQRDEVNHFIMTKPINGGSDLLVLVATIGSHNDQWYSNFDPNGVDRETGTSTDKTYHLGFLDAKEYIYGLLRDNYSAITGGYDKSHVKFLFTGHSRGAATANLLAAQFIDEAEQGTGMAKPGNIYAYTFATPNVGRKDIIHGDAEKYKCIFNIVNPEDFVTKVLPAEWGYARYGVTYVLPSSTSTDPRYYYGTYLKNVQSFYKQHTQKTYTPYMIGSLNAGESVTYAAMKLLTSRVHSVDDLYNEKDTLIMFGPLFMQKVSPYSFFRNTMMAILANYSKGTQEATATLLMGINNALSCWTTPTPTPQSWFYDAILTYFLSPAVETIIQIAAKPITLPLEIYKVFHNGGIYFAMAHQPETYCAYMNTMGALDRSNGKDGFLHTVNCPVDVEVYSKKTGDLVGKIVNNTVDETVAKQDNAIVMQVDGDSKMFWLPASGNYEVKLIGNDTGTMDYTVSSVDSDTGETARTNFFDVPITDGKVMTGDMTAEDFSLDTYSLTTDSGTEIPPSQTQDEADAPCFISTLTQGDGFATDSLEAVSGDYVTITATANKGSRFVGWYENDALVSTEPSYAFVVKSDRTLTAKFEALLVHAVELQNAVVQYKSALTLTPAIEADEGAAYTVAFTSSNPKIAEVDKDGKITTHKKGTVTITCTVTNNDDPTNKAETTCKVTVKYAWWQWLIRILLLGFLWY